MSLVAASGDQNELHFQFFRWGPKKGEVTVYVRYGNGEGSEWASVPLLAVVLSLAAHDQARGFQEIFTVAETGGAWPWPGLQFGSPPTRPLPVVRTSITFPRFQLSSSLGWPTAALALCDAWDADRLPAPPQDTTKLYGVFAAWRGVADASALPIALQMGSQPELFHVLWSYLHLQESVTAKAQTDILALALLSLGLRVVSQPTLEQLLLSGGDVL